MACPAIFIVLFWVGAIGLATAIDRRRQLLILSIWLLAIGVAMSVDRPVAQWVADQGWNRKPFGLDNKHGFIALLKAPGEYLLAIAVAVALALFYRRGQTTGVTRWQAAGLVLAAGAVSGLNSLLKWVAGRRRPVVGVDPFNYDLFVGGWRGLTGAEKNLAFPSGHAATAFALASALAILLPRYRWLFYAAASVTAIERFMENAHYVSDSVVGAAVGCLSTWTVVRIFETFRRRRSAMLAPVYPAPSA